MESGRLALLAASSSRFALFYFFGGVFKAKLLIINTVHFDPVFEVTVEGVDCNDGDLRCLQSGVLVTGQASVDFPFCTPAPLPLCRAFFEVPSFDFLEDIDFDFFMVLPGKAIEFFFFVALVMISFGILLLGS